MEHSTALEKLCRVCGKCVTTKEVKAKYLCTDYQGSLEAVYGIDTTHDNPNAHPQYFCHACKNILHRSKAQGYKHQTTPFQDWCEHDSESCSVCTHFATIQKGGRPKRVKRTPGRPQSTSPRYCIEHIRAIAPSPSISVGDFKPQICHDHITVDLQQLLCPICCDILQRPIELVECRSLVCMECCCEWLRQTNDTNCPCCHNTHLKNFSTIRPASALILTILRGLCVICEQCKGHVKLDEYDNHVRTCCGCPIPSSSPSSIEDILSHPLSTPLSPVEHMLQSKLAKRSMAVSPEENILKIKTGGQVISHMHVHVRTDPCEYTCTYHQCPVAY